MLSITPAQGNLILDLLSGKSKDSIAFEQGVSRKTITQRILKLRRAHNADSNHHLFLLAIASNGTIKEFAESKARSYLKTFQRIPQLSFLEIIVAIELLKGKSITQISAEFTNEAGRIKRVNNSIRRKFRITQDSNLILGMIALGHITFELNCIPLEAVESKPDQVWKLYNELKSNTVFSNFLYTPQFHFNVRRGEKIDPELIRLIQLRIHGFSNSQIAKLSHTTRQTISRKLKTLKLKYSLKSAADILRWALNRKIVKMEVLAKKYKTLNPSHEHLLERIYHENMTQMDIAADDGITPAAVSARISSLKRKFEVNTTEGVLYKWLCLRETLEY